MTDMQLAVRFAALFILAGYLFVCHRRRVLSHSERNNPAEWSTHGIDTTVLEQRLDKVRTDPSEFRPRSIASPHHTRLLQKASRTISRFAYFKKDESAISESD
jgi:hypothetical protein